MENAEERSAMVGTPDMPFKGTKQWSMLAMKRAISYAAEKGFDKIAWTTGQMQADRYDLSKQVDSVEYRVDEDGTKSVRAYKDENEVISEAITEEAEIEKYFGKAVAQKLIEQTPDNMGSRMLEAEDLKVGGEGMIGFYDRILVKETNKLLRKMKSGSEVGVANIAPERPATYEIVDKAFRVYGRYPTRSHAETAWDKMLDGEHSDKILSIEKIDDIYVEPIKGEPLEVHSFPLTTELRNKALGGMDKYSLGKPGKGKRIQHAAQMGELIQKLQDRSVRVRDRQKELAKYIQQSLPIPERGRREIISQITRLAIPKRQDTIDRYFQAALEMIDERHEEVAKRDATDKLVRLLKKTRPSNKKGHPEGRLPADTYILLQKIEDAITMDAEEAAGKLDKLFEDIEKHRHLENSTVKKDSDKFAAMKMEMFMLNRFADLGSRNSKDVVGAYEDLQTVIQSGRFIWQAEEETRKARSEELGADTLSDVTGEEDVTDRQIKARNVAREKKGETVIGKIKAGLKAIDDAHQSWEWFLDKMSRYSEGGVLEGKMTDHFRNTAHDATTDFDEGIYIENDKLRTAAEDSYGLKGGKLEKRLERNAVKKDKSGVHQFFEDGTSDNLTISQNEAYKLWQWMQDPSLKESMAKHGYTAETEAQLEQFIEPEVMSWAKWQLYEYYPGYYDSVNAVYRRMYNVDLPYNPMYTPMVRERSESPTDDMLLEAMTPYASVMNGSLKNRVENNLAPRLVDGDALISQHITKMEHFKAWAEPIREMRSVLGSRKVMSAINAFHGPKAKEVLMRFIDDFARGGVDRAMILHGIDTLRANFVKSVIGMNPVVFMKQLTSIPAYLTDMPVYHFTKGVADFAINPLGRAKILMQSKRMQARYRKGWERDIAAAMKKAAPAGISNVNSFTDAMMFPTKLGDKWAIMVGGWAQYKWKYDKLRKQGASKEVAHEKALRFFEMATERSQQASDVKDQGQVQRGGSLGKLFTMFMTSPQAYYRHISGGWRNLLEGRGDFKQNIQRIAVAQFILPMMFQLVASGFEWDDEDQLRAFMMGPLNGLFLLRDFAEPVINGMTGGRMWGSDGGVPLLTASATLALAAKEAVKIVSGDPAEVSKLLDKTASGLSKFAGLPYDPVKRWGGGMIAAAEGTTEHPVRRAMGFSKYALDRGDQTAENTRRRRPKRASRPRRSRPERR